jgi:two-component system chemotaxis sensor kinase CheA
MGVYSTLGEDFDFEIVDEFLSHYHFMCESMEPLIIGLESSENYSQNIEALFRIFHNIKSASGYLKITPLNKLATLAEEVLEECRLVDGAGSSELVDWLIVVSDQLLAYENDLESDLEEFSPLEHNIIKVPTKLIA